jgi:hypothetical protein
MTAKLLLTILKLALTCVLIVPGIASAQSPTPSFGKKASKICAEIRYNVVPPMTGAFALNFYFFFEKPRTTS